MYNRRCQEQLHNGKDIKVYLNSYIGMLAYRIIYKLETLNTQALLGIYIILRNSSSSIERLPALTTTLPNISCT
jgi:hypothetical protein